MRIFNLTIKKSFNKYLFCFLIIVCLFSVSYILIYQRYQNIIRKEINQNECENISRIGRDMDQNVYDVLKLVYQSKDDPDLYKIDNKSNIDYIDYVAIQKYISRNTIVSSFMEDMVFYTKGSNFIITKEGSFTFDDFFDNYMVHPSKNKFFWKEYLNKVNYSGNTGTEVFPASQYSSRIFPDKTTTMELIIFSPNRLMFKNMCFLILVSTNKIDSLCGPDFIIFDDSSKSVIFNSNRHDIDESYIFGNLHTSECNFIKIESSQKKNYFAYFTKSSHFNWYYIKIIPEDIIYTGLRSYNKSTLAIITMLFATTLLLSYLFSKKLYKPIKRIVDLISPDVMENTNEVSDTQKIYNYIGNTHDNYLSIEQKFHKIKNFCMDSFYNKLIRNDGLDIEENILNELNIKKDIFECFLIVNSRIRFKNKFREISSSVDDSFEKINTIARELINATISDMGLESHTFKNDDNSFISIVSLGQGRFNEKTFENKVLEFLINDHEYFYIIFSISNVYQGLHGLRQAYEEAIRFSRYCSMKQENQFITGSKINDADKFLIPKKEIYKMRSLLEVGKSEQIKEHIIGMAEFFETREIPLSVVQIYYITLFNELLAISGNRQLEAKFIDSLYSDLTKCEIREDFIKLTDCVDEIIGDRAFCEKTYGHNVVNKMVQFIHENYDKEIYLDMFADMYNMSPVYLSKLFKESIGVNFSEFVNKVRINMAKCILEERRIKIKDLSAMVGYKNSNTFIKVFKEYIGVSPGEYYKIKRFFSESKM